MEVWLGGLPCLLWEEGEKWIDAQGKESSARTYSMNFEWLREFFETLISRCKDLPKVLRNHPLDRIQIK
jgi:hypothetical protein